MTNGLEKNNKLNLRNGLQSDSRNSVGDIPVSCLK